MFLISLVIGLSQSPICKCWFVGFQNFLIFLLKTIHTFKRLFFFFEKIWLSAPGTQARTAGWAAVFGDLVVMDAAAPWSEPPSALPWTTAVASCRVCLFLLLILCSLCLTQQSVWWFKIYVSFHCSPQFKPHVTSDLSQSPNPTNGLQGPPRSALPLWPFQPWLDLFHSSRQILWLLCCFPVLPSLFPLSVFFCRCLYGSFPSSFWVSAQMSLPQWDRSLSATPPPLPAALALRFPWFVFLCYSHHQITRSLLVLLPPLGWKLCEVRDFSLFCSLNRITVGPEKASKY